ncbi:hypothetical protein BIW11_07224 [Tropilaelaps mercedesae]|uniref:Uncharacterized protein n=1 Tax=Tropilaelaps mercedesae TaxID=418985 RepID=A0A1V9XUS3_9ACAR|nr:hypothetical protein BIW11_07224 [Tropilaelaps mercedesae]
MKKIGRAIEKGAKKALEHGIRWSISTYSTHIKDNLQRDDEISLEELEAILWHIRQFTKLIEALPELSESNQFGTKLREGLEKIGHILNGGSYKGASNTEVHIPVSLFSERKQSDSLTILELNETLQNLDEILKTFNENERDKNRVVTYGFGKRLRKGLKKIGRAIEKGAKKVLERGFLVNVSVYSASEGLLDDDSRPSFEDVEDLRQAIKLTETATEKNRT